MNPPTHALLRRPSPFHLKPVLTAIAGARSYVELTAPSPRKSLLPKTSSARRAPTAPTPRSSLERCACTASAAELCRSEAPAAAASRQRLTDVAREPQGVDTSVTERRRTQEAVDVRSKAILGYVRHPDSWLAMAAAIRWKARSEAAAVATEAADVRSRSARQSRRRCHRACARRFHSRATPVTTAPAGERAASASAPVGNGEFGACCRRTLAKQPSLLNAPAPSIRAWRLDCSDKRRRAACRTKTSQPRSRPL